MPPCCGRASTSGAAIVWQWIPPGGTAKTYATKTDAEIARTRGGGAGPIVRTTQPAK